MQAEARTPEKGSPDEVIQVNLTMPRWAVRALDDWRDGVRRTRSVVMTAMIEDRMGREGGE